MRWLIYLLVLLLIGFFALNQTLTSELKPSSTFEVTDETTSQEPSNLTSTTAPQLGNFQPDQETHSSNNIAISQDGKWIAAINPDSNTVTILSANDHSVIGEYQTGSIPRTLAFTPNSELLVVTNFGDATLTVMKTGTWSKAKEIQTECQVQCSRYCHAIGIRCRCRVRRCSQRKTLALRNDAKSEHCHGWGQPHHCACRNRE